MKKIILIGLLFILTPIVYADSIAIPIDTNLYENDINFIINDKYNLINTNTVSYESCTEFISNKSISNYITSTEDITIYEVKISKSNKTLYENKNPIKINSIKLGKLNGTKGEIVCLSYKTQNMLRPENASIFNIALTSHFYPLDKYRLHIFESPKNYNTNYKEITYPKNLILNYNKNKTYMRCPHNIGYTLFYEYKGIITEYGLSIPKGDIFANITPINDENGQKIHFTLKSTQSGLLDKYKNGEINLFDPKDNCELRVSFERPVKDKIFFIILIILSATCAFLLGIRQYTLSLPIILAAILMYATFNLDKPAISLFELLPILVFIVFLIIALKYNKINLSKIQPPNYTQ